MAKTSTNGSLGHISGFQINNGNTTKHKTIVSNEHITNKTHMNIQTKIRPCEDLSIRYYSNFQISSLNFHFEVTSEATTATNIT